MSGAAPDGSRPSAAVDAEETLHATQAILAGILSIAADAIITTDEAQTIMHFNQGAEQVFGYRAEEMIGQPLARLIPERFRTRHHQHVREFGAGSEVARRMGHRREIYGLRRGDVEFPCEASIAKLTLPDGRPVYSAVLRDVSDRKRGEEAHRFLAGASAELGTSLDYEATLATIPRLVVPRLADWCALAVVEDDGSLRRVAAPHADPAHAAALEAMLARYPLDWDSPWPVVDVLRTGRSALVVPVTDDWLAAHTVDEGHAALLREIGLDSLAIVPLVARDQVLGSLTLARGAGTRALDAADEALARDFAVRAALALDNARLYRTAQRATAARDVVLGIVSHDLRNPLSAIAMFASTLRGDPTATEQRQLAEAIHGSAEWMQRLIQDLLDVAAIEAGQLRVDRHHEPVAPIVARLVAMFEGTAAGRGIALRTTIAPDTATVHGDGGRVLQVLANLVSNALKYTEPGGSVTIAATRAGHEVEFAVTDTGAGIPAEDLPHLFELYWHARRTSRARGSGYGLAIARGIVAAHGGRIRAESVLGEGSTFAFTIPVGD